jgi:hypothetical protein
MIFAAPWVLLALPALPLLWWLLRVTPPAPRTEIFPAVRLLAGLPTTEETPARTPWWLLLLRLMAAGAVIVGLAQPVLRAGGDLAGNGPIVLVIDDGWAAAADWPQRIAAADTILDRAIREGRPVRLLTTAPDATGAPPTLSGALPAAEMRARIAALRPKPWPPDRAAAARALQSAGDSARYYIADGLAHGDWDPFAASLAAGPVTVLGANPPLARLLLTPVAEADGLRVRLAQIPRPLPETVDVLAQTGDGRSIARLDLTVPANESGAEAKLIIPAELRNRLTRLVLDGVPGAGSVMLLDEGFRRRPVGLLAGDATTADVPLTGPLFYVRRALAPYAELRDGDLAHILARSISVLVLADRVVSDGPERAALAGWVEKGGLLLRFAGPATAEHPDPLMPVRLMTGDRQMGGTMSWSKPAGLAAFTQESPFAGLAVPDDIRVSRQILAAPDAMLGARTWASLADGTPLVTQVAMGAGRVVLFHVTANADWSDLPLSGLFVDMLRRLVLQAVGVAGEDATTRLAPLETLDGFGQLGPPAAGAVALTGAELSAALVGPHHPPGFYGPEAGRRALNLANHLPLPSAAPAIAGATREPIGAASREMALAPWLLAAALALLALDLIVALRLRGLLGVAAALLLMVAPGARAQDVNPALATRLAYVVTGDAALDGVSLAGLNGLTDFVNRRTNADLADPAGVVLGQTDLSFYPLLYWRVAPDSQTPDAAAIAALNGFMAHGGIILIDTASGGSGTGFPAGPDPVLQRMAASLVIPILAPLTAQHVLARAFYLLQDFPGRYTGDTVWVQRDQDRSNDSVSPVIIGGNDWASAWAIDAQGRTPYATIPGGARQRILAYRFGVNLVMYALTGNYKGDQVHVPAILERLGQ